VDLEAESAVGGEDLEQIRELGAEFVGDALAKHGDRVLLDELVEGDGDGFPVVELVETTM
jgi:hypothetical protein